MIADSVAFLAGEGKRVIYDAEHFFDAWRTDRDYALRCVRAAYEAGAENVTLCDTNASLPHEVADAVRDGRRHRHPRRHPLPQRRGVRRRELARGRRRGRGARAGDAERLRRALRQREPHLDRPEPAAQAGPCRRSRGSPRPAPCWPSCSTWCPTERAVRRQERVRAQGRHARRERRGRPGDVRAHRPRRGRKRREVLVSELSGKGTLIGTRAARSTAEGLSRGRAREGARAPRLPVRGRRRLAGPADPRARPASTSRCSGWSPGA